MADPILIECPLPPELAAVDRRDCETRNFDGHADHFYRVDAAGRLWRRACLHPAEEPFAFTGDLDIDTDIGGCFTWFRMSFVGGAVQAITGPHSRPF